MLVGVVMFCGFVCFVFVCLIFCYVFRLLDISIAVSCLCSTAFLLCLFSQCFSCSCLLLVLLHHHHHHHHNNHHHHHCGCILALHALVTVTRDRHSIHAGGQEYMCNNIGLFDNATALVCATDVYCMCQVQACAHKSMCPQDGCTGRYKTSCNYRVWGEAITMVDRHS